MCMLVVLVGGAWEVVGIVYGADRGWGADMGAARKCLLVRCSKPAMRLLRPPGLWAGGFGGWCMLGREAGKNCRPLW